MGAGQRPRAGQAQAGSAVVTSTGGIQAHQPFEDALTFVLGDAVASIGDRHHYQMACDAGLLIG
ncbi:MAG: hypothetical protein QOF66_3123 [Mycobacterium sp.]|nr:hypothetical protein [Mycobacterium sp.]